MSERCRAGTISANAGLLKAGAGQALSRAKDSSTAAYAATVEGRPSRGKPCEGTPTELQASELPCLGGGT